MKPSSLHDTRRLKHLTPILLLGLCTTATAQEIMRFPKLQPIQVKQEAELNNALALYIYGSLLLYGDARREAAPNQALPYIERAAELGVARAQLAAAQLYRNGDTIPQNDAKALQWFRQAALQGVAEAQYGLATLYEAAIGTEANPEEAARWYTAAAMQGHPAAQQRLGELYLTGTGIEKDDTTGYMWLTLAAAKGTRESIKSRDEARKNLSASTIARAQQLAANFRPQPHYNANMLAQEHTQLQALAKKLRRNPLTDEALYDE
jgi:TPR repeat protein